MKRSSAHESNLKFTKSARTYLIAFLIFISVLLTLLDWQNLLEIKEHIARVGMLPLGLILTETAFVVGAIIMAISAGEYLPPIKEWRKWPGHLLLLRRDIKKFAQKMLISPMFGLGFWLNFAGAIGTSLILLIAIMIIAPYTGIGATVVIVVDLLATFGWRIPLEINRRKARLDAQH